MAAYYNEKDPHAAAWLRELIGAGHIAPGIVDERSIEDVHPDDLREFTQCHFFAGIGGWSYALRLAGWPDDRPVWTGSCPCQPFSKAGKGAGFVDERHLWPHFHWLIQKCGPTDVLGEQVASKDAESWLDLVQADLEALGYAFGCIAFPAAGIGAPHIRDRAYWLGHANKQRSQRHPGHGGATGRSGSRRPASEASIFGGLADADCAGFSTGSEGLAAVGHRATAESNCRVGIERTGPSHGFWRNADWLLCRDGKWRPVEPGTFPLADGIPARVVRLRGYGNAINAEVAKAFIEAVMEVSH